MLILSFSKEKKTADKQVWDSCFVRIFYLAFMKHGHGYGIHIQHETEMGHGKPLKSKIQVYETCWHKYECIYACDIKICIKTRNR